MNRSTLLAIVISIILAAVVAWMGNAWIEQRIEGVEKPPEMVNVVVAAKDIPVDAVIDTNHLKLVPILPESIPAGALTAPEEVIGKRLKEAVYAGEVILRKRLLEDSSVSVLSATLTPGKRAVAVRVDDIIAVSGFVLPGSYVDIIAASQGQARTVLQNIKVLTVGQALTSQGGTLRAGTVTLEVDPQQAETLMLITETSSVRLSLRSQSDRELVEHPTASTHGVPGAQPGHPAAMEPPTGQAPEIKVIEIIKGTVVSTSESKPN